MDALILIDIQNDFLPGGALAVPDGDQVIDVANRVRAAFEMIAATQDWHPANHGSFASNHPGGEVGELAELDGLPQVLWPDHCIQQSLGAEFAAELDSSRWSRVVPKGCDVNVDSYSGFFDNGQRAATELHDFLQSIDVDAVFVMGLATDYCVKFTALDAVKLGYRTHLILDGCRGVDLQPGDIERAVEEMRNAGVAITSSSELMERKENYR
ncbi:MAG: bifunctional nicotinamidase/pyrazinamidase [Pirellulaceae bacterium]|jgi:nicotinamidase/pyrazinamidase|nr:bifunctional nicotinamidase/pyrazinamidase [Pirellulaceae bacterium]MDP7015444.1 bifunctional nicotinamidase/pyrazinamidase [Pirellulaceae bacterium]